VMQDGDCGSGCVEPMVELLALASLFGECFSQAARYSFLRASPSANASQAATRVFHSASTRTSVSSLS
jgi:hypothetical protein